MTWVTYIEWHKIASMLKLIHLIWSMTESSSLIIIESLLMYGTAEIGRRKLLIIIVLLSTKLLILISSEILIAIVGITIVWAILEIWSIAATIIAIVCFIKGDKIWRFGVFLWFWTHFLFVCVFDVRLSVDCLLFVCLFVHTMKYFGFDDNSKPLNLLSNTKYSSISFIQVRSVCFSIDGSIGGHHTDSKLLI